MRIRKWIAVSLLCLLGASTGAGGAELVVGQVAQLKNPASAGNQLRQGIQLYFDSVNETGGVDGNKLKLVTKDRGPDGKDSIDKTGELLQESSPIALMGFLGTGPMEALVEARVLDKAGVPMIGVRTGAPSLHQPVHPLIFHTRASYTQEISRIVGHLDTIGYRKIAVFHEKSVFGHEGNTHAQRVVKGTKGMLLVGSATYDVNSTDVNSAVATIRQLKPDAVIGVANSNALAAFYKQLKMTGSVLPVLALSTADGALIVKKIGKEMAHGLGIAQVIPDPTSRNTQFAREMQDDFKKFAAPGAELTQAMAEGYLAARVLHLALKRVGGSPTPLKLRQALDGMKDVNVSGLRISFSPSNHSGSSYVDIAVINPDGRMLR
jgi:ABC-type branched-subunit amino acid transport system substrate-binding protein